MSDEEILFFYGKTQALSLYEHVRECIMSSFPETEIKVSKTQISFKPRPCMPAEQKSMRSRDSCF